jgi:hypothetical protein
LSVKSSSLPVTGRNWLIIALVIIFVFIARLAYTQILHPLQIGWDPALHLQCAQLIVKGGIPYVDVMDVNPPLIWYLETIPAFLSILLNVPITLASNLFLVFLLGLSSLLLARFFLRLIAGVNPENPFLCLGALLGFLAFNFFLRYDFGQREEISALLVIPFFVLRLLRYRQVVWCEKLEIAAWLTVLTGVLGGVGICLKHYFLLNALACEFFLFVYFFRRPLNWRALFFTGENYAALALAVLYLSHFAFATGAMRENYFAFLVPAFGLGYAFWDTSLANSLAEPDKRGVFYLLCLALSLVLSLGRRSPLLLLVSAYALSGLVPYLLQFKGWAYHDMACLAGASVVIGGALGLFFAQFLCRFAPSGKHLSLILTSLLGFMFLACLFDGLRDYQKVASEPQFDLSRLNYQGHCSRLDLDSPFVDLILDNSKPDDTVLFIANGVSSAYPVMTQLRRIPGSRHVHACILSVLSFIKDIKEQTALSKKLLAQEAQVISEYGQDIQKKKPVLVFVQQHPVGDYLQPYDFQSRYLRDYDVIDKDFCLFVVYKLRP